MKFHRKWLIIAAAAVIALATARAVLPYAVTGYVNRALRDMPDYAGSIADVDLALHRGAYAIDGVQVFKVDGKREIPFIDIPRIELRVQWNALFKGALAGSVVIRRPVLNFINKEQSGEEVDWAARVKELFPIRINRLEIVNGTVIYYDFTTEPVIDMRLQDLQLVATNFANVEAPAEAERKAAERAQSAGGTKKQGPERGETEEKALPAAIRATAISVGDGELDLDVRLDPLREPPDLDMNLRLENIHMPALNEFFRAYAGVDVEQGTLSVYSELAMADGIVEGYIRPVAEKVEVVDLQKDKGVISLIWQGLVDVFTEIFENERTEQLATEVPLSGDLNNLETSVWTALWNIYRNAFVEAFGKSTKNSIDFGDVSKNSEGQGAGGSGKRARRRG